MPQGGDGLDARPERIGAPTEPLLTHPGEPLPTRRGKGRRTFDPDHVELSVMTAVLAELQRLRAAVGWKPRAWTVSAGQCTELLERLREGLSLVQALDAVRANVWMDAKADPSRGGVAAELAEGRHANLTRIFRPGHADKNERWIEDWIDAGRPEPSPATSSGRQRSRIEHDEGTLMP